MLNTKLLAEEYESNEIDMPNYSILLTEEVLDIDVEYEKVEYNNPDQRLGNDNQSKSDLNTRFDDFNDNFIINDLSEDINQFEIEDEEILESKQKNQTSFDFDISLGKFNEDIHNQNEIKFDLKKDVSIPKDINDHKTKHPSDVDINIDNESIGQDSKISFVKKDNGIANFEIADIEVNDPEVLSPKI